MAQRSEKFKAISGGQKEKESKPKMPLSHQKAEFKNSIFGVDNYVLDKDLYREYSYRELEYSSYEFVPFLTGYNNLLDTCYAALMTSATNRSIIEKKVNWTIGDGFIAEPKNSRFTLNTTMPTDTQKTALAAWLDAINPEGETIDDVFEKTAFDYYVFGNGFVEFIRKGKEFYQRQIPFEQCRLAKMTAEDIEPKAVGISKYWLDLNVVRPPDLVVLPLYPNWSQMEDGTERSVYHIKEYSPVFKYYGCPDYIGGLIACNSDYQIDKYNNSRLINGFMPSAFMTVYGAATPDEAKDLITDIEDVFTGTGANSKLFVQCLADKSDEMDIKILDDRKEGSFTELSAIVDEKIVRSHRFTPSLAGIATAGQLGSNQQIRTEFEFVYADCIRPSQNKLLKWVNISIMECEKATNQNFATNLGIKPPTIFSIINDIPVAQVLTPDEMRSKLGYQPLKVTTNAPTN